MSFFIFLNTTKGGRGSVLLLSGGQSPLEAAARFFARRWSSILCPPRSAAEFHSYSFLSSLSSPPRCSSSTLPTRLTPCLSTQRRGGTRNDPSAVEADDVRRETERYKRWYQDGALGRLVPLDGLIDYSPIERGMEICVSKLYGPPKVRSIHTIRKYPRGCGTKAAETAAEQSTEVNGLTPSSEIASSEKKEGFNEDASLQEDKVPNGRNVCVEKFVVDNDTLQETKENETACSDKTEGCTEDATLYKEKVSNTEISLIDINTLQETKEETEGCTEDAALYEDNASNVEKLLVDIDTIHEIKEKTEGCTEDATLYEDKALNTEKSLVDIGTIQETKDEMEVSAILNLHRPSGDSEVEVCTSKLYGSPKRRKTTAIRHFPPGCGPLAAVRDIQYLGTTDLFVSLEANNLIEGKESSVDKIPFVQDSSPAMGSREATGGLTGRIGLLLRDTSIDVSTSHISEDHISVNNKKDRFSDGKGSSLARDKFLAKSNGYKKSLNKPKPLTGEVGLIEDSNNFPRKVGREKTEKPTGKSSSEMLNEKLHFRASHRKEYSSTDGSIPIKAGTAEKDLRLPVGRLVLDKPEKGVKNKKRRYTEEFQEDKRESTPVSMYENLNSDSDRVIVLALMASSYCPWRHGKGSSKAIQQCSSTPVKAKRKIKSSVKSSASRNLSASRDICISEGQTEDLPLASIPQDEYFSDKETETGLLTYEYPRELSFMETPSKPPDWNHTGIHEETGSRNRVRRALRLFQVICRKLLQEEESKSRGKGKANRVDLEAANILKKKNEYVNPGKSILGLVPGVEIGDEFHYRTELAVIGLHRPFQAGIDRIKKGDIFLATSIVAGCGSDEMESSDILVYSGSGGSSGDGHKPPEDQKLEGGNLALKNSMEAKEPVRVIRSSKEVKIDSRDGKARPFSTFVYDGLYTVEKYWKERVRQGYLAFKFELRKIPGQRELPSKEVKKSHKPSVRPGVCIKDISDGKEKMPVCVVNTIDDDRPSPFRYITRIRYPSSFQLKAPRGCDCADGCSDSENCACAVKNGGEIPYNYSGAIVQAKPLVYECGPMCKCPPTCYNRVSQHGIKISLEVFKTKSMGWGVRSLSSIASGSFICEYIGELIPDKEAELRTNDEYLFDIGHNYDDHSLWEGLPTLIPELQSSSSQEDKDGAGFTIDAAEFANVGRFINHSCSPNLYAQNVLYDHDDKRMPHIMLFAAENIPPLQELTYHYNYMIDQVRDSDGEIKRKDCYCGSDECTGRLY